MLRMLTTANSTVLVGAPWMIRVVVTDEFGAAAAELPVFTVTEPDGTDVLVVGTDHARCAGVSYATYVPDQLGRHVATVDAGLDGFAAVTADVVQVTANGELPDVAAVVAYLGGDEAVSFDDDDVEQALEQERAAQARICRVPAAYPADLAGALLRRTQRALSMRSLALAVRETADGDSSIVVPGNDPEVRRLERPHRKLVMG